MFIRILSIAIIFTIAGKISFGQQVLNSSGNNSSFPKKSVLKKHLKKARKFRSKLQFEASKMEYLKFLENAPDNFHGNLELGLLLSNSYHNPKLALPYFEKAKQLMPTDTVYEVYRELGKSYQFTENYQKAIEVYQTFAKGLNTDKFGNALHSSTRKRIEECNYAMLAKNTKLEGTIKNLGNKINSQFSEYVPVFIVQDSILLYTTREENNVGDQLYHDEKYFEDIRMAQIRDGQYEISPDLKANAPLNDVLKNTRKHEAVVSTSAGGDTLILYLKNHLWYTHRNNGKWSNPERFSSNINFGPNQRHGSLTADGKTLYFSSNHKDGFGGFDLYKSILDKKGNWGEATNLGDTINTPFDEDGPSISKDGKTLHFSSKGHQGIGGYDFFKAEVLNGTWSNPKNLGAPLNSPGDDLYLKMIDKTSGYFSSNRYSGYGDMDLYSFQRNGVPMFKDCEPYANKKYTVNIEAVQDMDSLAAPITFEWDMGDGTFEYGNSITHVYNYPSNYQVSLNVIDSISEHKELRDTSLTIAIDNVTHIAFSAPDTVKVGSEVALNGAISMVKEYEVTHHFWRFSNDNYKTTHTGAKQSKLFSEQGTYHPKMEILAKNKKGEEVRYCTTQPIVVISAEAFDSLANADSLLATNKNPIDISDLTGNDSLNGRPYTGTELNLKPIYFDFDKDNIRTDASKTMEYNLSVLKQNSNVIVQVIAHTDAFGSDQYNIRLSERRARSTVKYLLRNGFAKNRIKAALFFGESQPKAPNSNPDGSDNPEGRQLNRRAELIIVGTTK